MIRAGFIRMRQSDRAEGILSSKFIACLSSGVQIWRSPSSAILRRDWRGSLSQSGKDLHAISETSQSQPASEPLRLAAASQAAVASAAFTGQRQIGSEILHTGTCKHTHTGIRTTGTPGSRAEADNQPASLTGWLAGI